jgi:hypothetical protein
MFLFLWFFGDGSYFGEGKIKGILSLAIIIPVSVFIYGVTLFFAGFPEVTQFRQKIRLFRFNKRGQR